MKLFFPIFASLMLQSQVNAEFFGVKKCLMGFGKCKDSCTVDEKEIKPCKNKKCCMGPKIVQMIRHFIQSEDPGRRHKETDKEGREPDEDFHDPDMLPRRLRLDLGARHQDPPGRAQQAPEQQQIQRRHNGPVRTAD
ncbi:PREDICTED: beta-defensin 129 [Elephantulus edwardii]|uniref:beta-defensin 129 n=1 Tax=Elephantulus edwardii TaxID=28737 RepID=UPI0003F0E108|nr:PREDICTED: beta-defensin 129 [Elephantulus edwardii]